MVIHGGDVIAYQDGVHRLLRGGGLADKDDRVGCIGRTDHGAADHGIDATGKLVLPGLVRERR
jgi:cytosine/adenosine deaminase-related metal-dependent hydrolase